MPQMPGRCYDLDMSDPHTAKGVSDYTSVRRCILIKGIGYLFVSKDLVITEDTALNIAQLLAEIGPMPTAMRKP